MSKIQAVSTILQGLLSGVAKGTKDLTTDGLENDLTFANGKSSFGKDSPTGIIAATAKDSIDATFEGLTGEAKEMVAGLNSESLANLMLIAQKHGNIAKGGRVTSIVKRTSTRDSKVMLAAGSLQHMGDTDSKAISLTDGLESFAPTEVDTFVAYSATYNIAASKQSSFANLFYKPVMQDPLAASFDLEIGVLNYYDNTAAPLGGAPYQRNLKSLIKTISTGYDLIREDLRLYPINRTENNAYTVPALAYDVKVQADEFESTAPIKNNVTVDMGNLGLRTALAAKGAVDFSDSLSRDISVEFLYLELTGTKDDNGTAVEVKDVVRIPLNYVQYNKFTRKVNGEVTAMTINEEITLNINVGELKALVVGTSQGALDSLSDNLTAGIKVRLTGDANIASRNVWVRFETVLSAVYDNLGNNITTSPVADDLKALFAEGKKVDLAWYPKCYAENSNLRHKGLRVTETSYYVSFPIAYNAPVQVDTPIIDGPGNNSDKGLIRSINISGLQMDQSALKALFGYKETLRTFQSDTYSDEDLYKNLGVASWLVYPTFIERETNVVEITNNVSSAEFLDDVKSSICNDIRDVIIKLATNSKILDALRIQAGEEVIGVSVGIGAELAAYVTKEDIKLGNGFDVNVESTNHNDMNEQIIITLQKRSADAEKPHILDRGWMVFYPDIAGVAQITENDNHKNIFISRPGYNHINNMPIMGYIKISGLDKANKEIMARAKVYRLDKDNLIINS